jgi:hypothetical protein
MLEQQYTRSTPVYIHVIRKQKNDAPRSRVIRVLQVYERHSGAIQLEVSKDERMSGEISSKFEIRELDHENDVRHLVCGHKTTSQSTSQALKFERDFRMRRQRTKANNPKKWTLLSYTITRPFYSSSMNSSSDSASIYLFS